MGRIECDNLQLRSLTADWNADHLGRFRQAIGGVKADIDLAEKVNELRLTLHSELAQSYFRLRFIDEERRIVEEGLDTREANLALAKKRSESGLTSETDVAQAEADLASTRADLARMTAPRTKLENAIGSLVGVDSSCFKIESSPWKARLPIVKAGVPVSALGNRPDVCAAIARLKIANTRIGLERCQYFPPNDLIENGESCRISCSNFMEWSCRTFTCCPSNSRGLSCEKPDGPRAAQEKALVDYQKTMLDALREVDNALADLAALCSERDAQILAVSAAKRSVNLSKKRYDEGDISSTEMSDAESGQFAAERRLVQIRSQQYVATVKLIEALGGRCVNDFFSKL